jgi:PAS domain S-box-containing protein
MDKEKQSKAPPQDSKESLSTELAELNHLYNSSPLGFCLMDTDLRYLRINKTLADINGKSVEEHIGKRLRDIVPSIAEQIEPILKKVLETGQPALNLEMQGRAQGETAEKRSWIVSYYPVKKETGEIIGVGVIVQNITERKQVEKALKMSQITIEYAPEGIFFMTRDAGFSYVNEQACRSLGYPRDELLSLKLWDIDPVYPKENWEAVWTQHRRDQVDTLHADTIHRRKDGVDIPVEVSAKHLWLGDDEFHVAFVRDVTEKKAAHKALQASELRFRTLAAGSPVGIFENDETGNCIYVNEQCAQLVGLTPGDCLGQGWRKTLHPDDISQVLESWTKASSLGEPFREEYRFQHSNGSIVWVIGQVSPKKNGQGEITGYIGTLTDITDRKLAEQERSRMENQLRELQKMESMGTLAGGIAHDFNNILTAIIGFAYTAKYKLRDDSPVNSLLDQVLSASDRARNLVNQILAFSSQSNQEMRPLQIQFVIKEIIKFLQASIPASIEIKQDIDHDCGPVMADPTQIHQVIMNLCTNAYQAMQEKGGVLAVSLSQVEITKDDEMVFNLSLAPGNYAKLGVSDTGHGLDRAIIDNVFDPYFTTKPRGKGTGLGLSIVHGIVKGIGGHVTVFSEPEKGSTFTIYLPLIKSSAESDEAKPYETPPGGNERILFVDDEETIAQLGMQMLKGLGYRIKSLTSSKAALEEFQAQPENYDLVITDMDMPNMTGAELAQELLILKPDIPIILCTGYSELIDEAKAKAVGIREFLMKPTAIIDLANVVRKVLDKKT